MALVREGWNHLRRQRPLAAQASWQRVLKLVPNQPAASQALDLLEQSPLPKLAKTSPRFRPPKRGSDQRTRWDQVLGQNPQQLEHLHEILHCFTILAHPQNPSFDNNHEPDPDAIYNRALCLAWLGENLEAVETLDQTVQADIQADPNNNEDAIQAWMLAEILRQGQGAERLADELSYFLVARSSGDDGENGLRRKWNPWFERMGQSGSLRPLAMDSAKLGLPAVEAFEWIEPMTGTETENWSRVMASVLRGEDFVKFSSPVLANILQIRDQLPEPTEQLAAPLPLNMLDAAVWLARLPAGLDEQAQLNRVAQAATQYYKDIWLQQPRRGLDGLTPAQAAKSPNPVIQAKLEAIVRIRGQVHASSQAAYSLNWRFETQWLWSLLKPDRE